MIWLMAFAIHVQLDQMSVKKTFFLFSLKKLHVYLYKICNKQLTINKMPIIIAILPTESSHVAVDVVLTPALTFNSIVNTINIWCGQDCEIKGY